VAFYSRNAGLFHRNTHLKLTERADLLAPGSVHWEVGNALAAMLKRGRAALAQIETALDAYEGIPIRFVDVELSAAMTIAARFGLYAYDAYVIACAVANRCRLITLDRGLLAAAAKAGVVTVEVPA
jgi:predicted nucleic acid-binding protein